MVDRAPVLRLASLAFLLPLVACGPGEESARPLPASALEGRLERIVRFEMSFDPSIVPEPTRAALDDWIEAGELIDRVFWQQSDPGAWEERGFLAGSRDPGDRKLAVLLSVHAGRFDRLQAWEPFLGPPPRPLGGGMYPPFVTDTRLQEAAGGSADGLLDPATVVEEGPEGLRAVPYAEAYGVWLEIAARSIRAAAAHAPDAEAAAAWEARAVALETGSWNEADGLWVTLPAAGIEAVLGPYGRGEDRLTGHKLAFEAMIGIVQPDETQRAAPFVQARVALATALAPPPIPGAPPPASPVILPPARIVVADELYRGGHAAYGRSPVAGTFPAPGFPPGTRTILWRNRMEVRRAHLLSPLAARAMEPEQAELVTPAGYFTVVLMRELVRTLEPAGSQPSISGSSREIVDEVRIGARGLRALGWFVRNGSLPAALAVEHHAAYLAMLLAAVRPIDDSPAGSASVVALNWHRERGAIGYDPRTGAWSVDFDQMLASASALAEEVERAAAGDALGLRLLDVYGPPGAEIRALRARTSDLPLEVAVTYAVEP